MSRLTDVIDNHTRLDEFMSIMKHHGVNAAFITDALLQAFEQEPQEDQQSASLNVEELVEDLQQYKAHF